MSFFSLFSMTPAMRGRSSSQNPSRSTRDAEMASFSAPAFVAAPGEDLPDAVPPECCRRGEDLFSAFSAT